MLHRRNQAESQLIGIFLEMDTANNRANIFDRISQKDPFSLLEINPTNIQ